MITDRIACLVREYRAAREKLSGYEVAYEQAKVAVEIRRDMLREFELEKEHAKRVGEPDKETYWEEIESTIFAKDTQLANEDDLQKIKDEVTASDREISYYKKKIKVIGKILGDRFMTLLEGYEQKSLLVNKSKTSDNLIDVIEEDEAQDAIDKQKKTNEGYTFGKM